MRGCRSPSSAGGWGSRRPRSPSACSASSRAARSPATAQKTPEVVECHRVTGDDCYVMKAHVRDVVHLEEVIDRFAVLGQTTTSIVQSSPVPVRGPVLHEGAQLTAVG